MTLGRRTRTKKPGTCNDEYDSLTLFTTTDDLDTYITNYKADITKDPVFAGGRESVARTLTARIAECERHGRTAYSDGAEKHGVRARRSRCLHRARSQSRYGFFVPTGTVFGGDLSGEEGDIWSGVVVPIWPVGRPRLRGLELVATVVLRRPGN